jgi:hypothetical protein
MSLAALDAERVATLGLLMVAALLVLAFVSALLARAVLVKVAAVAALLAIVGIVWSQRAALQDCVDEAKAGVTGAAEPSQCSFLGLKVDVRVR